MSKTYRIAIGSIMIECNHLGGIPADIERFRSTELRYGREVLDADSGVVGGVLQMLRRNSCEVLPTIVASGCPAGPITSECYRHLKTELLDRLRGAAPVDGVLLPLHGAAAVEDLGDPEGDLLAAVRDSIGPDVPVVVTLDLHAHVTAEMVRLADAIFSWETYPHVDAFQTGVRGAKMLLDILRHRCRPTMAMAKVPVLVGAVNGGTEGDGPFAEVMRFAKSQEGKPGVLSTSVFLVHPYLDLPEMGGGGLVITNDDLPKAEELAREIAMMYWHRRFDLEPALDSPTEAVKKGLRVDGGPVLLVETADCCGGGAAGDSVASLRALLDAELNETALVPVVDPEAAEICHRRGVGSEVILQLGHKLDPKWGTPLGVTGTVAKLSDGTFTYTGGIWEGQQGHMGPTAVLAIGAVRVLIASRPTYDWADEQFRCVGLDVCRAKFVVAKNPMNYRIAYADVAQAAYVLDTPGPTPATMRHHQYQHLQRPYFPADQDIPGLTPTVLTRV
ncbi:MAG: M81 family metallopeptidase [Planctomycetes bacterium]|nr:M81 family metallopeptidase [Planctomycetota bacterium]